MAETNEPTVHEEVKQEIAALAGDTKKQYEELNKSYTELKHQLEAAQGKDNTEMIEKLKEDLVTRQEALDKQNQESIKRMDDIEVALKRPGNATTDQKEAADLEKRAAEFAVHAKSLQCSKMPAEFNGDDYAAYKKEFAKFIRSGDEHGITDAKALSVGVDPHGGYGVTPEMSSRVIERIYEMDPIRQLSTVETISSDALELPVDWDQADAGWVAETEDRPTTDAPNQKKKKIFAHEIYAQPEATQILLEDSAVDIEGWLSRHVGSRMARLEGAAFVSGDGIGKPRGFLNYDNGTSYGQIEQVSMGAADAVTMDGFISIKYSMVEDYLNRGTWLMNRTTVRDTMKLKDNDGNYLWKPAISADAPSTILSLPVRMSTTMPAVAANALSVALADWRTAYTIVDRVGISLLRDPYTNKPFIRFYFRKRVGGDVVNYQAIKIGKISA